MEKRKTSRRCGPQPAPRRVLHRDFKRAWRNRPRAMTVSNVGAAVRFERSRLCGLFTGWRPVIATPHVVAALAATAAYINYEGPIFK